MFRASSLCKSFGPDIILDHVSVVIDPHDRIGLVGPNGCGKTTLLRMLAGVEIPDSGSVSTGLPATSIGYLPQGFADIVEQATVGQVLHATYPRLNGDSAADHLVGTWQVMRNMEDQLGQDVDPAAQADLLARYAAAVENFVALGGYEALDYADDVLRGLDLAGLDQTRPLASLSGGQKTRVGLARLLMQRPDLLLLDEPTNHLDTEALRWLETFVHEYAGAVVVISHDRRFLDNTIKTIWEIDPTTHRLRVFAGTYSNYQTTKETERAAQEDAYKLQQEHVAAVEEDIRDITRHARSIETETIHFHYRKQAAVIARRAVVRRRKLERLLDSTERVEKPAAAPWSIKLELPEVSGGSRIVLEATNVVYRYPNQPVTDRPVLRGASLIVRAGERVALTGLNGCGKSTLLHLIAGLMAPDTGTVRVAPSARLGYFTQEHQRLDPARTPLETVRSLAELSETDARRFLHQYLFAGDDVFTPIGKLSYGERARLALGTLVLQGATFLMLDEPLNHLDINAREKFEAALLGFDGTVLAVLHDRYAIDRIATRIVTMHDGVVVEQ